MSSLCHTLTLYYWLSHNHVGVSLYEIRHWIDVIANSMAQIEGLKQQEKITQLNYKSSPILPFHKLLNKNKVIKECQ